MTLINESGSPSATMLSVERNNTMIKSSTNYCAASRHYQRRPSVALLCEARARLHSFNSSPCCILTKSQAMSQPVSSSLICSFYFLNSTLLVLCRPVHLVGNVKHGKVNLPSQAQTSLFSPFHTRISSLSSVLYCSLPPLLRLNVPGHRFHLMPLLRTFTNLGFTKRISRNCPMSVEIISGYSATPTTLFGSSLRLMKAKLKSLVHRAVWQVASSSKQWATWWAPLLLQGTPESWLLVRQPKDSSHETD